MTNVLQSPNRISFLLSFFLACSFLFTSLSLWAQTSLELTDPEKLQQLEKLGLNFGALVNGTAKNEPLDKLNQNPVSGSALRVL